MSANVVETINDNQYTLCVNATWRPLPLYELHYCLGHIPYGTIRDTIQDGLIEELEIDPNNTNEQSCTKLFWRSHLPMQVISEKGSIGTYGDLQV